MKIKRIIFSDFLSTMMSTALSIYIYWFAYRYYSSQFMVSIVGFGQLSGVLLSSLGGGISDSMNKVSFIKYLKIGKVCLLFTILLLEGIVSKELLLPVFMFGSTVIGGLLSPTLESLLPSLAESDEDLFRLNSIVSSLTQLASIAAVVLSAFYISLFSFSTNILLTLIFTAISALLIVGIHVDTPLQSHSVLSNIQQGCRFIFNTPYIRNLIPLALFMNFSFWSIFLLLPKITQDNFSFLEISYSGLELAFSLGGIIGGIIFTRFLYDTTDRFHLFKLTLFTQSLIMLLLGLILLIPNPFLAYVGILLTWFSYSLVNTIFSILYFGNLQLKVPENIIGSVFGSILTIFSLVNPIAAIMSGFLVSILEIPILIIILAVIMMLAASSVRFLPEVKAVFD